MSNNLVQRAVRATSVISTCSRPVPLKTGLHATPAALRRACSFASWNSLITQPNQLQEPLLAGPPTKWRQCQQWLPACCAVVLETKQSVRIMTPFYCFPPPPPQVQQQHPRGIRRTHPSARCGRPVGAGGADCQLARTVGALPGGLRSRQPGAA